MMIQLFNCITAICTKCFSAWWSCQGRVNQWSIITGIMKEGLSRRQVLKLSVKMRRSPVRRRKALLRREIRTGVWFVFWSRRSSSRRFAGWGSVQGTWIVWVYSCRFWADAATVSVVEDICGDLLVAHRRAGIKEVSLVVEGTHVGK